MENPVILEMPDREIITLLLRKAVANQERNVDAYTEANDDPNIQQLGNAAIANALEFLGGKRIVGDVQPTLGVGGLGFSYRIDASQLANLTNEQNFQRTLNSLCDLPTNETVTTLGTLLVRCERSTVNAIYREDLLASIKELQLCFTADCYIACLALSGKLLEICLKQALINNGVEFDDKWMLGRLISKLKESNIEVYLDQSLPDLAKIINNSRIPAVHSGSRIPVPSKDQAIMVIHALIDTVNRVIVNMN